MAACPVSVMNSPSTTVIGGDSSAIDELLDELEKEERWCRKVRMTVAAHTAQMDPVLEPLKEAVGAIQPKDGEIGFYSSSQNTPVSGSALDPDYWVSNVRNSVQFGASIRELAAEDRTLFIEIGPHAVLTAAIEENIQTIDKSTSSAVVSSFYREKDEVVDLYKNLGESYSLGIDIDWKRTHQEATKFILLPQLPMAKRTVLVRGGTGIQKCVGETNSECHYGISI